MAELALPWQKFTKSPRGAKEYSLRAAFERLVLLSAFLLLLPASRSAAEEFYFAELASGTGNGKTAADPKQIADLNSPSNWSSPEKIESKIGPGDTVHLVGTITSQIVIQKCGTAAAPVVVLFDTGANMSAPAWPETGAICLPRQNEEGLSHIIIDGGTDGLIQNTDNGTLLGHQSKSSGVWLDDASAITIRNLTIGNMYVHPSPNDDQHAYGSCVLAVSQDSSVPSSNVVVTHCRFHDARVGFAIAYGKSWSNFEYSNCVAYNCNWGGIAGDAYKLASLHGLQVCFNQFKDWSNWDDTSKINRNHHNGFFGWAASGGTLRDVAVFGNRVGPHYGGRATSGVYFSGDIGDINIFNNLFVEDGEKDHPMDGLIFVFPNVGSGQAVTRIYNNTFVGAGTGTAMDFGSGQGPEATRFEVKNNIAVNVSTFIAHYTSGRSTLDSDNNIFFIGGGYGTRGYSLAFSSSLTGSAHFLSFDSWKQLGHDNASLIVDPKLDGNFRPAAGSQAHLKGLNLSPRFQNDKEGHPRPSTGPWDIGAFQD